MTTICQLLHSLSIGGAEVLAARIGRRLGDRFRFVYACLDELGPLGQDLLNDGFTVHQLGRRDGLDHRCVLALGRFLRQEKVDIVHAHQFTPYFYATLARAPFRKPAVLFTEHGRFYPDYRRPKRVLYNKIATSRRDRIIAVGQAVRQALMTHEGFPPNRVQVIYNGINLDSFRQAAHPGANGIRAEFNVPDSAFLVAHVARLDPIKDHLTAIRAVSKLTEMGIDARLLIVGDGPQRSNVEQARASLSADNIILAGMRRDIPNILAAADALLLTSLSEGIPLTIIEAMAAGVPVVSTDVGGVREVVIPEQTGLLASVGDDAAIAEQLRRLAEQSAWAVELGAAGRALAIERFSEDAMVSAYTDCFAAMAPPSPRRTGR